MSLLRNINLILVNSYKTLLKWKKQRMLQELQHIRIMKFNNDFNRIKPGIDKYIADKRKEDAL